MNVAWLLEESARRTPHRGALCYDGQLTSYAELADRVGSLAAGLRGLGLVPGDRVLLCLPNRPELVETLLATLWAGMVTVPMNWHLHPDEIRYVAEHSGARAVLVADRTEAVAQALPSGPNRPLVLHADRGLPTDHASGDQAPADVDADQPAWLFYTSGTTGRPKGATLSHRNLLAMALNYYADVDPVPPGSVFVHAAPLTHGSGLYLIPSIGRAATNVISAAANFDPVQFINLLEHEHATHAAFLAPTMLRRLLDCPELADADLSALRSIVVGGAPLYQADLTKAVAGFGPLITQIYGQGEAPMTITVLPAAELAAGRGVGSCGRPFVDVQVRVLDALGREASTGIDGEICVRGDVVMAGYWQDADATDQTVRDGWLYTGDIGYLDDGGYLHLTDRAKDVIITGGSNVYPREVEEVLLTYPGVREAAVIGLPDPDWGESIGAYVVTESGVSIAADDLIAHVRTRLASFKKPRTITFVDALPKNATGKILKRELRSSSAAYSPSRTPR